MNPIADALAQHPLLILDGALATELERRGCDLADPLWSAKVLIENPALIQAVHADYFVAGADVAITASYQATIPGFMARGLSEAEAIALLQRSVELARAARDAFWAEPANRVGRIRPLVAASIGPYGAYLHDGSEYRGNYGLSIAELIDFHRPRMAALANAEPDLFACETIPCGEEARALVALLPEFPHLTAWISFSARDGSHTAQGEPIADVTSEIAPHPQVAAIGVNCTAPRFLPDLIRAMRAVTDKPIVVYPNSGEVYDPVGQCWIGAGEIDDFADQARLWYTAGARLIGGCCRTTPDHIRALAAWVVREVLHG
ncbi:homocysteine S-methyltransferase [uncultured Chloroflexus sp.]|uniref:homocysteine S-methyltransferase n=1 Tax=uncultured Chloroflexus sp. TaxID=214040 RepID=UPI002617B011|nr:homocysteine S-methyltransferase [uncultured Chloroflexus sp.]